MPTTLVPGYRCGADWSGWLDGTHPTVEDVEVQGEVCFNNREKGCKFNKGILIRNCESYFIYKLRPAPGCASRYCGTD